jgi:hypothetical protein
LVNISPAFRRFTPLAYLGNGLNWQGDLNLVSEIAVPGNEDSRRRYYEISLEGRTLLDLELARIKTLFRRPGYRVFGGSHS